MKVASSFQAVKNDLDTFFVSFEKEFETTGWDIESHNLAWTWHLIEEDVSLPKGVSSLLKSNPEQYLAIAISRGKYKLQVIVRPETGKSWHSSVVHGSVVPAVVAHAIAKRSLPASSNKWSGMVVEIYMPMHQRHPGLAEHAIVGGVSGPKGVQLFLSDKADPNSVSLWPVFQLHPEKRMAQSLLSMLDKEGQKYFRGTLCGQSFDYKGISGEKMTDEEIRSYLSGVKKFCWTTDATSVLAGQIPQNARKFKLGEELTPQEMKELPLDFFFRSAIS